MTVKKKETVTMRIRIGESELEVAGPSDFVEKKITEFIQVNKQKPLPTSASVQPTARPVRDKTTIGGKRMSAAQFFKKVNPRTDIDRTLAAGYYLEIFQGMDNFTSAEMRDTIRKQAKTPPPKNPSDAINKNIKKGFIMSAGDKDGKMAFVLTSDGEEAVNEMLQ